MHDTHTKYICVFREVMGFNQDLIQQIISYMDKIYLLDIRNYTKNFINMPVSDLLAHIQYTYVYPIPHELLKQDHVTKRTSYHHFYPITSVYATVEGPLEFQNAPEHPYYSPKQLTSLMSIYIIMRNFPYHSLMEP